MPARPPDRPHLFLDVDGVLNAFRFDGNSDVGEFDDFATHEVEFEFEAGRARLFLVRLSPTMGARLARLEADIQWATTWEHRADSAIAPLCGLPRGLPVLSPLDEDEEWDVDWKFCAVRRSVERDPRPFVWIDDDLDFFIDGGVTPREWAVGLPVPSLLIAPDADIGLVHRELRAIERFVRQHGPESTAGETSGP